MATTEKCTICGRELGLVNISQHHLIPKSRGGKDQEYMHDICHAKLHATFANKELEDYYHTPERLLENEEMVKFVNWVKNKSPEFYNKNDDTINRKNKRRR